MHSAVGNVPRISVGTHYRVWWFWLPIVFGCLTLVAAGVLLPIFPALGLGAVGAAVACFLVAIAAGLIIERGRRWVELGDGRFRLCDHSVQAVIADDQVTDLALHRQPHHGAGKLLAETRHLVIWIATEAGPQRLKLTSRMAPGAVDPLQPLIDRLCRRLSEQAARRLVLRETVDGDGWSLDATQLQINTRRQQTSLPLDDVSAIETIGQEVRLWRRDNPHVIARLPVSGRNGWLLERLIAERVPDQHVNGYAVNGHANGQVNGAVLSSDRDAAFANTSSPLGRILFERAAGSGAMVIFGVLGLLLGLVGGVSLWVAIGARDPVMSAAGGLLVLLSGLCFAGGLRVRRVRFRCYERGLERISMTTRKVLPFDDIDVFSFESRRNQSQGRYTGTTYTLVFADRSREQGRGLFYSTTVRNHDAELDDLVERISQTIARRMAQTFAAHHSVQWTPEVWFQREALEFTRRRRLFIPTKFVVVPYETITDFDLRDGVLHIWTTYQQRAVLSLNAGSPNFYPGLILLEGLAMQRRGITPSLREPNASAMRR